MNKILKTGLVIFGFVIIFMPLGAQGVTPAEVLVLIDSNSSISRRVGEYYALKRRIPGDNILYLSPPSNVVFSYSLSEYKTTIEQPVMNYIQSRNPSIKYIVLSWGFGYKVEVDSLRDGSSVEGLLGYLPVSQAKDDMKATIPTYYNSGKHIEEYATLPVYIVGRIDGYTEEIAKRIIDDAISAEQTGVVGKSYLLPGGDVIADRVVALHEKMKVLLGEANAKIDKYELETDPMYTEMGLKYRGINANIGDWNSLFKGGAADCLFYYGGDANGRAEYYDVFDWVKGSLSIDLRLGETAASRYSRITAWAGPYIAIEDSSISHKGNHCVLFDNSDGLLKDWYVWQATFTRNGNGASYDGYVYLCQTTAKPIILSGWNKTENVGGTSDNNFGIEAKVKMYDTDNPGSGDASATKSATVYVPFNVGTHSWEETSKTWTPSYPIKYIDFKVIFKGHTGKAWIDDLSIVEADNTTQNFLMADKYNVYKPGENYTIPTTPQRHFPDFEIWDSSYPGWDASENAWLSGNNVFAKQFALESIVQGATGAMGKTGHGNYWRGWDGAEDYKLLEWFVKGYSFGEALWMTAYKVPNTFVYIGDPLYNPYGAKTGIYGSVVTNSSVPVNVYPQPFKASVGHTVIHFTKLTGHTRIQIFNVAGELVYDEEKDTPTGDMEWNVVNSRGEKVSSGIYFYVALDENKNLKKGKLAILR